MNSAKTLKLCLNVLRTKARIPVRNASSTVAGGNRLRDYDVCIVGGGIVGLATAREAILRHPDLSFCLVEKEKELSIHQTGHNSGVVHMGLYYKPGSLKARLCVKGAQMAYDYCDQKGVPYNKCGKIVVAVEEEELGRLDDIHQRSLINQVKDVRMIDAEEIARLEPNCRGLRAIHSPHTGIVDWRVVALAYGEDFKQAGGDIYAGFHVNEIRESSAVGTSTYPVAVENNQGEEIRCKYVITCAGLQADRIAKITGNEDVPKILPFRGDYLMLKPEKSHLVKGNIYPVPNPNFPFLGVHFTPRMNGDIWLGPNAVLAFKREGYNLTDVEMKDFVDAVGYPGLQKLAMRNLKFGIGEMYRGFHIAAQVELLRRYVPGICAADVIRGPSGVRAQAVDVDGNLVDDFVFEGGNVGSTGERALHVTNAPSPAATSSLAIAEMIADEVDKRFNLV